jgi:hypothetical protein
MNPTLGRNEPARARARRKQRRAEAFSWAANPRHEAPAIFHSGDEDETWTRCGDLPPCERVWRTDHGGQTWSPSGNGLPTGKHNVLREGMVADALDPAGVSFGTTAGALFASTDGGMRWQPIAEGLRHVQSVAVSVIG